ncbi:hypothetical protein GYA93_17355 [Gordonia desulfuricans]|uniref:Clp R domain-containing protein n=1 Tax=Gordonia desulfuricans TaxID=89051 RepID=A0A7K3LSS7_9ACTN|nr:Clp protease N-terminal domain-containing protein [Gordonia desulfuricans]NDK91333.1 hypothetical protein [Gordonia desulfuricans]
MPKINVYLPDDLALEIKQASLPVSALCQRALRAALDEVNAAPTDRTADEIPLSPHVASTLSLSYTAATRRGSDAVASEDLLQGLLDEEESLVLKGIEHLGFSRELIQEQLDKIVVAGTPLGSDTTALGPSALDVLAIARADAEAMRTGIVNGGNLLWALMTTEQGDSREVLAAVGLDAAVDHRVLGLIEIGYSYGRHTRQNPATVSRELARISARLDDIEKKLESPERESRSEQ